MMRCTDWIPKWLRGLSPGTIYGSFVFKGENQSAGLQRPVGLMVNRGRLILIGAFLCSSISCNSTHVSSTEDECALSQLGQPALRIVVEEQEKNGRCKVEVVAKLAGEAVDISCRIEEFDCICEAGEKIGEYTVDAHFLDVWITQVVNVAEDDCGLVTEVVKY